jgi:hypothetical protein
LLSPFGSSSVLRTFEIQGYTAGYLEKTLVLFLIPKVISIPLIPLDFEWLYVNESFGIIGKLDNCIVANTAGIVPLECFF